MEDSVEFVEDVKAVRYALRAGWSQ
jgi:hypothetical protein